MISCQHLPVQGAVWTLSDGVFLAALDHPCSTPKGRSHGVWLQATRGISPGEESAIVFFRVDSGSSSASASASASASGSRSSSSSSSSRRSRSN